ncbi:SatD family protein [Clostridium ljungdahlii]|uniref:SatD family (SatD) n=1 Tax=Clostridium ljungdahlii TaxID=1538 RepID=A0A168RB48_9CLOT|nr:SatD family protein [Clostridium ljungdahlii]OAA90474.1 hypothetical protein WY13_01378 [Clostridium ljungdahlii]
MNYLTMICDLKKSRKLVNREKVQYQLIDMLKGTNKIFQSIIVVPFIITIGDEWEGLLNYDCNYMKILDFFHKELKSVDFYCGIGIGPVSIKNFELTVNQLDGPSFYLARDALIDAKNQNLPIVVKEYS